jgi:hypothetical protein
LPRFAGQVEETPETSSLKRPEGRGRTVQLVEDEPAALRLGRRFSSQELASKVHEALVQE